MKIAFINSVYGIGSTGKIVESLNDKLSQSGNQCVSFYGRASSGGGVCIASPLSVKAHAFFSRIFGRHGLYSKRATKNLIAKVKEFDPDVINIHNIHGYYLNYKILFEFLREYKKPVVWTLHDLWQVTGHCAYFDEDNDACFFNGCVKCGKKCEYPKAIFDNTEKNYNLKRSLFTGVDNLTLACPSIWIENYIKKSFLSGKETVIINNGLDLSLFCPTESDFRQTHGLVGKKLVLGVALQWSDRKGLKDFNRLADDLPDDYKVVLVGVTDKDNVNKKILALPKTKNQTELIKIYSACNVFVNPTLNDNFPTVNIEALSCGLPVITYDAGGSAECINDLCGKAVKKGDYNALKQAICSCEYDKRDCLDRAKNFTIDKMVQKYKELFERVAN